MKVMMGRAGWLALALVLLGAGCVSRSPVLLYRGTKASGSTTLMPVFGEDYAEPGDPLIPLKAGVRVAASRRRQVTSLSTYIFPFYIIRGGLPKRDEMEFLRDSVVRDLQDTRTFLYTYPAPFDPSVVDVIVDITPTDIELSNLKGYGTLVSLPVINLLLVFGVPQEIFSTRMAFTFEVKTHQGKVLKRYTTAAEGWDGVTLYELPWANYMWARSVFREKFLECMDDFRRQLLADAEAIQQDVR